MLTGLGYECNGTQNMMYLGFEELDDIEILFVPAAIELLNEKS